MPIDVTLPAQDLSYNLGGCSASFTTGPIALTGATAEVPAFSIGSGQTSVTIPNVTVNIPGATLDGGSGAVQCNGTTLGSVDFSISFSGTATSSSATLDTATKQLTLTATTVELASASVSVPGWPSVPLPVKTLTLPKITIDY